jgi:hypothetical protein
MFQRNSLYLLVNSIAPVLAIVVVFEFMAGNFPLAWACALGIVLCMESRVQLGGRVPHTTIFWMHLVAAVPFFLALTALAFLERTIWLEIIAILFGIAALCTGAILWYRGVERRVLHLR